MKRLGVLKGLLIAFVLISAAEGRAAEKPAAKPHKDYVIAAGDVLDISIWKNEELTKIIVVLPDGKISFPLIGEVMAEGKTVAALKKELVTKLSHYVPNPTLSVVVQQVNSMLVYVVGKVNEPGRFLLTSNIRVLQGIALAGGLDPFARKGDIKVFREEGDETRIFKFNYNVVSKGKDLSQNIKLKRGDVIVVP
jgi:polysaccharide export outer membrane protein